MWKVLSPVPDICAGVQLQTELDKCERVIDSIVEAHHLGFNHAIDNYAKILSLFQECKTQVRTPRSAIVRKRYPSSTSARLRWVLFAAA